MSKIATAFNLTPGRVKLNNVEIHFLLNHH